MERVDARGMSCPQPVLMTKNALEGQPQEIEVMVDSNTAKNNVTRFLKNAGYEVAVEELEEDILIKASR